MMITRVPRGEPRRAVLAADSSVTSYDHACLACGDHFRSGDWVVDVPLGPGAIESQRDLVRRGFEFEPVTVPCHHACVTGYDEPGTSRLEKQMRAAALRSEVEAYVSFQKLSPEDQAREVAVAAQGLRDPSFDKAKYISWRRSNIATGIKALSETIDPEALVAEYGGTW
jgi:hypothetical protein